MLNQQSKLEVFGQRLGKFPGGVRVAVALAVAFSASSARAQECANDADCGFGFRCYQQVVSTTTSGGSNVTTVGTTVGTTGYPPPEPVCGDSICDETEDPETCAEDCGIISYCVGATCESDSDCAEDYACQPEGGVYSTTTTGAGGPFCGDRVCEDPETEESCVSDCSTALTCQVARCETDADCDEGFYCDPRGGSAVSGASSSGGGSGGTSITIELYLSECLATDGGGGNGPTAASSSANSVTTGAGIGGSHGGGHHGPRPPRPPRPRPPKPPWGHTPGCALAAAPLSGGPFLALAGMLAFGFVQRRRRNG